MSEAPENKPKSLTRLYDQVRRSMESSLGSYQVLSFWFANHLQNTSQKLDYQTEYLRSAIGHYLQQHPQAHAAYDQDVRLGIPAHLDEYQEITPQLEALDGCIHVQKVLANYLPEIQQFEERIQALSLDLQPEITPDSGLAKHIQKNTALLEEHQQCIADYLTHLQSYPPSIPIAYSFIKQCETLSLTLLQYELDNAHYYGTLREFNISDASIKRAQAESLEHITRLRVLNSDTQATAIALEGSVRKAFLYNKNASEEEIVAVDGSYTAEGLEHVTQMLNFLEMRTQEATTREELNRINKTMAALARNNCHANEQSWQQLQGTEENPGIILQLVEQGINPYTKELFALAGNDGPIKKLLSESAALRDELASRQRQIQI